jgi:FAD/FMN-containing dehydrogenase
MERGIQIAEALARQTDIEEQRIETGADSLARYFADFDPKAEDLPRCAVFPKNGSEIEQIVRFANEQGVALTPRSSRISRLEKGNPAAGGIVVDLQRMNRILEIDGDNKRVKLEPGVTFQELEAALAESGLQYCNPFFPHPESSVLTSSLERDPILIPKPEYTDTFLTAEIVLPNGELFRTGSAIGSGLSGIYPDGLFPGINLFKGAQGTFGIVVWANLKLEWRPVKDRLFFVPFRSPSAIARPMAEILRKDIVRECFIVNDVVLRWLNADRFAEPVIFDGGVPEWTALCCLSGGEFLPEEKIEYQQEALQESLERFNLPYFIDPVRAGEGRMECIRSCGAPSQKDWRGRLAGGPCKLLSFFIPFGRFSRIYEALQARLKSLGWPAGEVGVYLQPVEYGRAVFCEFLLPCGPGHAGDKDRLERGYREIIRTALDQDAFFSNPCGAAASEVFERASDYLEMVRVLKEIFDPRWIMNPDRFSLKQRN